ncbi:cysteinyl-tRNA synthetase [Methylopila capsulata]|uniref:Cysteine--tRNA ligase n=1 Tax=Methylopila capsulata TaxID=61654 RepID=A0A9W6IRW4_9HYPH|nr:cysteine--tRNA ligase [Methylopila capsulata]MBM7850106.1 cysteinyl-tRNA synthetase [Methylopila capsulata]GLK55397.1 cysteine--tRNA ligase [Methylopila capsulata]
MSALKIYNSLTRTKDDFAPIDPANVRMYVCGPTVYDRAHIGNARPVIVFDLVYRLLRHLYGADHVTYVRNVTDVDDKINARAAERGISIGELTEDTARGFREDVAELGTLTPSHEPRATEFICRGADELDMVKLVERLIARGHAYEADGHVLFDVASMPAYGRLARRSLDEMEAGARVEVASYKKGPMDFVLWKPSKAGEPAWESPWGQGRPGWHLECSAMSAALLGETFDIHGGGIDLIFPHHENEIAQSTCCFGGDTMANVWMHNGFLQVEGEKMSKSLGNFVTIREVLADWPGDVARLAMLAAHYRQPINWTLKGLQEAERTLSQWFEAAAGEADPRPAESVVEALSDDLNTPKMIAEIHRLKSEGRRKPLAGTLAFLGFRPDVLSQWHAAKAPELGVPREEIERLVDARLEARRERNWAEADRIRDELLAKGVVLKDGAGGTTWEVAR